MKQVPLVDLGDCEDVFVSGWENVEKLQGNLLRFTGFVEETINGQKQRRVRLRVVLPVSAVLLAIADAKIAMAQSGTAFVMDGVLSALN